MNCMEISKGFSAEDRAVCWSCFLNLSRVFFLKGDLTDPRFAEIRKSAEEMNRIFKKHGCGNYFDEECSDVEFYNFLMGELEDIRASSKRED